MKMQKNIQINIPIAGCSIRVETLGNFDGKSRLPRQNSGTLEKLPREKFWAIFKHMFKKIPEVFLSIADNTMENRYIYFYTYIIQENHCSRLTLARLVTVPLIQ